MEEELFCAKDITANIRRNKIHIKLKLYLSVVWSSYRNLGAIVKPLAISYQIQE